MRQLATLATRQHGLLTRGQLRAHGIDRHRVARWVRSGRLAVVSSRVLAIGGSVDTPFRRLLAMVLETGTDATVSHTTAAWMWGLAGYTISPAHLVVSRWSRRHERLPWTVHQFTDLPTAHRRTIDRVPVTSPALTMLHLAQVVRGRRLERSVDAAWSLGILTGGDLDDLDAQLARSGRDGIVALREVAKARGTDWIPPQSNIESRFMELVGSLGHDFRRQVPIAGERWTARVDFLHARSATIVEIQSERYHTSLTDQATDRIRRARLEAAGYVVIEVWDTELFHRPDLVVDRVFDAVHRAA